MQLAEHGPSRQWLGKLDGQSPIGELTFWMWSVLMEIVSEVQDLGKRLKYGRNFADHAS